MPSPRDTLLRLNAQNRRFLDRIDAELQRSLVASYEEARREIVATIEDRRRSLAQLAPGDEARAWIERQLALDAELLMQVELRTRRYADTAQQIVREAHGDAVAQGRDLAGAEMEVVARGLNLSLTSGLVNFDLVEVGLEDVLGALGQDLSALAATLRAQLRLGLLQGESFDALVARLLAADASVFARGKTSALLAARRTVITAENATRDTLYQHYQAQIPGLQKQALAAIATNTTDCCLRVHGQVQPLSGPYILRGTPHFAREMMYPAFHWNCRTASVPYHADFERGASSTTEDLRREARDERQRRAEEQD